MRTRNAGTLAAVTLAVIFASAFTWRSGITGADELTAASADAGGAPMLECRGCDFCSGTAGHILYATGERTGGADHVGECWEIGPCFQYHTLDTENCGGGSFAALPGEDRTELWRAVTGRDLDAIRWALKRHPGALVMNAGRSALQVTGCSGDVLAHIPLTKAQATALD